MEKKYIIRYIAFVKNIYMKYIEYNIYIYIYIYIYIVLKYIIE